MASFHGNDPDSIRRRLAEIAEVEASRRHVLLRAVGGMLASLAISLLIMAWGFSMDDAKFAAATALAKCMRESGASAPLPMDMAAVQESKDWLKQNQVDLSKAVVTMIQLAA